ncbi:hypothetical protein [Microvirga aerophila]|nr:hypothetical protein [Microvirga aerophila]
MLSVQSRLPLGKPFRPRTRNVRRPFTPLFTGQRYRLPRDVRDRLTSSLAPFRNRDAAFALATFLGRFWSTPGRIGLGFPIDRRELAKHPEIQLTEKRVRSAIHVLEEIGFLDRAIASGSRYKPTEDGLRRKPILFVFGSEYAPTFIAANKRAAAVRGGCAGQRRAITRTSSPRPSVANAEASPLNGPKSKGELETSMLMGPLVKKSGIPPLASESDPRLEAALDRLLQGIRQSRGG